MGLFLCDAETTDIMTCGCTLLFKSSQDQPIQILGPGLFLLSFVKNRYESVENQQQQNLLIPRAATAMGRSQGHPLSCRWKYGSRIRHAPGPTKLDRLAKKNTQNEALWSCGVRSDSN
jgi:hypothetical protein